MDLDRKRHRNREAIRAIDSACKSHWAGDDSKTWLAMGNSFFRLPAKKATELLKKGTENLWLHVAVPWFVSFTFIFFAKTLGNLAVCRQEYVETTARRNMLRTSETRM